MLPRKTSREVVKRPAHLSGDEVSWKVQHSKLTLTVMRMFCIGATEEQIEAIQTTVVGASGVPPDSECKCPICLEDFLPGAVLRCMDCTHTFHKPCLDRWLTMKATCPICQRTVADKS